MRNKIVYLICSCCIDVLAAGPHALPKNKEPQANNRAKIYNFLTYFSRNLLSIMYKTETICFWQSHATLNKPYHFKTWNKRNNIKIFDKKH